MSQLYKHTHMYIYIVFILFSIMIYYSRNMLLIHFVYTNILYILASTDREGNGTPLQYSCLENFKDRGAWWAAVHGVTKSRTRLSDFTFQFHALEKEMATHSSVLAWRIPGMGEPGGLPSMGLHRVGYDCSDLVAAAAASTDPKLSVYLSLTPPLHQQPQIYSLCL